MLRDALAKFQPTDFTPPDATRFDPRWNLTPPAQGLVVRVSAKVLDGYAATDDPTRQAFQESLARDNLWIRADEQAALVRGEIPKTLAMRIARFHLIDNTRGEPPLWDESEVRSVELRLNAGKITGTAHLETRDGSRGFRCDVHGVVTTKESKVTRLDIVAKGDFWGEGTFTRNAPKGRFPFGVAFTLADGTDVADKIPPQGSRGWLEGYLGKPAK